MSTVIDLGALGSSGFLIQGGADSIAAGYSVSNAGDINGDGFDDILIGVPFGTGGGGGTAYVVFGKASGFGTIDLDNLSSSAGFAIEGAAAGDSLGVTVANVGDINGDGFDDLALSSGGNPYYGGSTDRYVVFGQASGFGTIDVGDLSSSDGFLIEADGGDFYDYGGPVSGAGDVNGDGFDDIIVGDWSGGPAGLAYVIFGQASGFGTIDLGAFTDDDGFVIEGDVPGEGAGYAVGSAGDVNGDGFDDILVSAPWDNGQTSAGKVYVIFGHAGAFDPIDLGSLSSSEGFRIEGAVTADLAGWSVSTAGDFNGDGYADILIGAQASDSGGTDSGAAYIVFGKASGFGTINLGTLSASHGVVLQGHAAGDFAGTSVSAAGDVNGDGYDDVIIGATGADDGGDNSGAAYVIYGRASGPGMIDLTGLDASAGFIIQGDAPGDFAGQTVSGGGDIDGDGFDDLIVSATGGDKAGVDTGQVYVIFGRSTGLDLTGTEGADTLRGGPSADELDGRGGNDLLYGLGGNDRLLGGSGNDRLEGGSGIDRLYGGAGNDLYIVRDATDYTYENPGEGVDTVHSTISLTLRANVERLTLTGTSAINGIGNDLANIIKGNSGANVLRGGAGDDKIYGGAGADAFRGEAGNDWIEGGAGRDRFYGGTGADSYVFRDGDFAGMTSSSADQIHDFGDADGDRIRLNLVDADSTTAGTNEAFAFVGTGAFTGTAGELRYEQIGANTFVQGDLDGDGLADFWIRIDGLHTLAADDFIF